MNLKYLKHKRSVVSFEDTESRWDYFISAFNDSGRVKTVFNDIDAEQKLCVYLPEYGYQASDCSDLNNSISFSSSASEADVVIAISKKIGLKNLKEKKVCIDITGFMRSHILYLARFFHDEGIFSYDMLYTEPAQYKRMENTEFSNEEITSVRQVIGFEGNHVDEMNQDVLLIGVGYDDALISRIINDKESAKVIQLLSLPSLSPDMYQESILRLDKTGANFNVNLNDRVFFAPANNPFVVAAELSEKFKQIKSTGGFTNMYLCPLATKPQTLGFALFYLTELINGPHSIVFPFSRLYHRETSVGVGRSWLYEIRK